MYGVREAAVAGQFYPADPARLGDQIDELLGVAESAAPTASCSSESTPDEGDAGARVPRAIIAPHAGYVYSGPIAASAFQTLAAAAAGIRRVVLIGPSHFVPFTGVALPEAEVFRTPLGDMPLDAEAVGRLHDLEQIVTWMEPHRREHALEVELPFLQRILGGVPIVPLVTGAATPEQVAEVLDAVWEPSTLLVVSSDLSHFHDYDTARRLDADTAEIIVAGALERLDERRACGRLAIQGMKLCAARRKLGIELLDLRNSGDTAGRRDSVVGYGAFCILSRGDG